MTRQVESTKSKRFPSLRLTLIWSVICTIIVAGLAYINMLPEGPEKFTYDLRMANFSKQAPTQRKDIAVVLISEDTLAQYWSTSPVDRMMMAELITALDKAGAKAIGLDFIYDKAVDPRKTEALLNAIKSAKTPIILGAIDKRSKRVKKRAFDWQDNFLKQAGREVGHLYFDNDKQYFKIDDNIVRYVGSALKEDPKRLSFAELLANVDGKAFPRRSSHIAWLRPPKEGGKTLFPTYTVPEHAPIQAVGDGETVLPSKLRPLFKDKIVLIGGDFVDRDKHITPLSYFGETKTSGVFIHAQIIAQLRDDRSIHLLDRKIEYSLLFVLSVIGFLIGYVFNLREYDVLFSVLGTIVLIGIGIFAFSQANMIIPATSLSSALGLSIFVGHIFHWYNRRKTSPINGSS